MNATTQVDSYQALSHKITATVPTDLFPLPLTTFEKYMLTDDCPEYPMGFVIEIRLTGQLDKKGFEFALDLASRRHPLLLATISTASKKLAWKNSNQIPAVEWIESTDCLKSNSTGYINLRKQTGLQTTVRLGGESCCVSFLFHHAVVDGVGAMHFIGDLLAIYGQCTSSPNDPQPELSTVTPLVLHQRGELDVKTSRLNHSWRRIFRHLFEFLYCNPSGIISPNPKRALSNVASPRPFLTRILSRTELTAIKNKAAKLNVAPNDIYLAALFQTIKKWNELYGGRSLLRRYYRIAIPSSLRTPVHDNSPAANIVSYIFLNQSKKTINHHDHLIQSISQRTKQLLSSTDSRLPLYFLKGGFFVPGLVSSVLKLPLRLSTATLANVGDVKRQLNCHFPMHKRKCIAGSVTLEGLFGAAPIRKRTSVGISVGTYAGELLMNFNCASRCFSPEEAEQFADLFVSTLLDNNSPSTERKR